MEENAIAVLKTMAERTNSMSARMALIVDGERHGDDDEGGGLK